MLQEFTLSHKIKRVKGMPVDFNADSLNILGAKLTFIAYGALVLAAETQAKSNKEKDEKIKEDLSTQATNLNDSGNLLAFAGDTVSAIAGNLNAFEDLDTKLTFSNATKANLLGNWLSVVSDIILIYASKLEKADAKSGDPVPPELADAKSGDPVPLF